MVAGGEEKRAVAFKVMDLETWFRVSMAREFARMEQVLLRRQELALHELAHSMPLENGEAGRHG